MELYYRVVCTLICTLPVGLALGPPSYRYLKTGNSGGKILGIETLIAICFGWFLWLPALIKFSVLTFFEFVRWIFGDVIPSCWAWLWERN